MRITLISLQISFGILVWLEDLCLDREIVESEDNCGLEFGD